MAPRANTIAHGLEVPNTSAASSASSLSASAATGGGLSNSTPNLRDSEVRVGGGGLPNCRYSVAHPSAVVVVDEHVEDPQDDVDLHVSASREQLDRKLPKVRVQHEDEASSSSGSDNKQDQSEQDAL